MTRRRALIWLHDTAMTAVALGLAFLLRWGWADFAARLEPIGTACLLALPVALAAYAVARLDRFPWKYAGSTDLTRIALAAAAPAVVLGLVDFVSRGALIVPRTVPFIYYLAQVALLAGPRLLYRSYRRQRTERRAFQGRYRVPVLVAGTGEEALALVERLRRDPVAALEPVGLLTAKPRYLGERIGGVPVLGGFHELETVLAGAEARGQRPRRLIVTREALGSADAEALAGAAGRLGLAIVRPAEGLTDLGAADSVKLSPVSIDDLLGRPPREMDLGPARALVAGRAVAVTGAGGSIGSEICRQVASLGARRLLLLDLSELALWSIRSEIAARHPALDLVQVLGDVRDASGIAATFASFRPELVFHAAALKHVDIVETHPAEAAATNTLGTEIVGEAAVAAGALCAVFISTDKAVAPVSILGATKRAGEHLWAERDRSARLDGRPTRFVTVRFGNVLGSSGSVLALFARQLAEGGPVTVTHPEVERYFMTVSEAVRLVLMASSLGSASPDSSPTFVLDMGEPVRILDLARRAIRLAGLEPDVDVPIRFTGLRPGERLQEVLEAGGEALLPTSVPGVTATRVAPRDAAAVRADLQALAIAVASRDAAAIRAVLRRLVPDYRPENAA
jgi:FlaA1/EpsC-like NDP-sugar epimerase